MLGTARTPTPAATRVSTVEAAVHAPNTGFGGPSAGSGAQHEWMVLLGLMAVGAAALLGGLGRRRGAENAAPPALHHRASRAREHSYKTAPVARR